MDHNHVLTIDGKDITRLPYKENGIQIFMVSSLFMKVHLFIREKRGRIFCRLCKIVLLDGLKKKILTTTLVQSVLHFQNEYEEYPIWEFAA